MRTENLCPPPALPPASVFCCSLSGPWHPPSHVRFPQGQDACPCNIRMRVGTLWGLEGSMAGRGVTCTPVLTRCISRGLGPGSQQPLPSLAGRGGQILPESHSLTLASSKRRAPPPSLGAQMPAGTSGSPSAGVPWLFQPHPVPQDKPISVTLGTLPARPRVSISAGSGCSRSSPV